MSLGCVYSRHRNMTLMGASRRNISCIKQTLRARSHAGQKYVVNERARAHNWIAFHRCIVALHQIGLFFCMVPLSQWAARKKGANLFGLFNGPQRTVWAIDRAVRVSTSSQFLSLSSSLVSRNPESSNSDPVNRKRGGFRGETSTICPAPIVFHASIYPTKSERCSRGVA